MNTYYPTTPVPNGVWPTWPLKTFFTILFFGPIITPLFQATGLPFIADTGAFAHSMLSHYICPTPAKSYYLFAFPMGVCVRCWAATIGLWGGWFLFQHINRTQVQNPLYRAIRAFLSWHWMVRLAITLVPFLLWVLEITMWSTASLTVLLFNGMQAGLVAGLFFCSIWPGLQLRTSHVQ